MSGAVDDAAAHCLSAVWLTGSDLAMNPSIAPLDTLSISMVSPAACCCTAAGLRRRGRAGLHESLVLATGLSQRHAYACAEAVAWQLRERASMLLGAAVAQQDQTLLPALAVLGDAGADWCVVDAGPLVVHVMTPRARQFYDLEGLWGGPRGRALTWMQPLDSSTYTLHTIGRSE